MSESELIDFDMQTIASPQTALFRGAVESPHVLGERQSRVKREEAFRLYDLLGAEKKDDLDFFPGMGALSEALFLSAYKSMRETGRNHIVTTECEEAPITKMVDQLELLGAKAKTLDLNQQGQVTAEALYEKVGPRTGLVSLSWANPLTGVVQPIYDIAKACQEHEVALHVDATHVIGRMFWQFRDFPIDYLSLDGGRLYAPRNSAVIFSKESAPFRVKSWSWHSLDLDSFSLLRKGCENLLVNFEEICMECARLRDRFEQAILEKVPGSEILFADAERLPNISAIAFPKIVAEALLFSLSQNGVLATRGGGQMPRLDHLLRMLGKREEVCLGSLSFALPPDCTEEQVDRAAEIIVEQVRNLQSLSIHLFGEPNG